MTGNKIEKGEGIVISIDGKAIGVSILWDSFRESIGYGGMDVAVYVAGGMCVWPCGRTFQEGGRDEFRESSGTSWCDCETCERIRSLLNIKRNASPPVAGSIYTDEQAHYIANTVKGWLEKGGIVKAIDPENVLSPLPNGDIYGGVTVDFPSASPEPCSRCGGSTMIPSEDPDGDVMNTPCPECNEWSPDFRRNAKTERS